MKAIALRREFPSSVLLILRLAASPITEYKKAVVALPYLLVCAIAYFATANTALASLVTYTVNGNFQSTIHGTSSTAVSGSFQYDTSSSSPTSQDTNTLSVEGLSGWAFLTYGSSTFEFDQLLTQNGSYYLYLNASSPSSSFLTDTYYINGLITGSSTSGFTGTITGPPLVPVPAPPAGLMMATGLGIIVPLSRRHGKAKGKSAPPNV